MNIQSIDSNTAFQGLVFKDHAPITNTPENSNPEKEQETASAIVNFSMNAVTAGQNTLQNKQAAILERTQMAVGMVENQDSYAAIVAAAKQAEPLMAQLQATEVGDEMQTVLDSVQNDIEAAAEKALETKTEQTLTEELETATTPESTTQAEGQSTDNAPQNATQDTENAPQNPSGTPASSIRTQPLSREAENLAAQAAASANPATSPDSNLGTIRSSAAQKEHKPLNIIV